MAITKTNKYFEKNKYTYSLLALKKPIYKTNSNTTMISYIIFCGTLWKISEVNWLKIGGVVQVSELDHQFFVFHLFFHVDLVQLLQGSKITPHAKQSCSTRQH